MLGLTLGDIWTSFDNMPRKLVPGPCALLPERVRYACQCSRRRRHAGAIWNTGQDYESSGKDGYLTAAQAASTKFLMEALKTQPLFVPGHIEFQAGWYLKDSDTYAEFAEPSNTLLATRVMFQNGLELLNYYPLSDSLYPAGYEFPSANHFYTWESAINYAGQESGRAIYVRRNGRLLAGMGPLLASTHLLPDAGLVYPWPLFRKVRLPQTKPTTLPRSPSASCGQELTATSIWN